MTHFRENQRRLFEAQVMLTWSKTVLLGPSNERIESVPMPGKMPWVLHISPFVEQNCRWLICFLAFSKRTYIILDTCRGRGAHLGVTSHWELKLSSPMMKVPHWGFLICGLERSVFFLAEVPDIR